MAQVAIIMGSKSDLDVVRHAAAVLKSFGVSFTARIISAHRTPGLAHEFAASAAQNGYKVIIAAAGKAAHLAGVIAGCTTLPVVALPILGGAFSGLDSLLSSVQMPAGVPVACVAVNGGENAGLLAVQILALSDAALQQKLAAHKREMADKVLADDKALNGDI
ncbi:MAG: 5-(carboxyamino)imidazole ribonucleotide mutase [Clostridiales bacterium]|jgi:5-(carboxyamino)imidazole ribonucleotide mutase|nr:5-(carboxyamino)imidazole ribonucleotide mutase [Clostridiales bacterium]